MGAALCCALAAVPGARAASGGIPSSEAFTFTGSLTYSWHGDPARGCARERLCSLVGSITFRSDGSSQAFGGIPRTYSVDAIGTSAIRVRRGGLGTAGSGSGDCVEVDRSDVSLRLPAGASGSATSVGSLSSGRCAGPTSEDLSRIRIPMRISGTRLRTIDFGGRRPFVAGPFSGELVSALVLRPQRTSGGSSSSSSSGSPGSPVRKRLIEFVDLRYRVAILPSALVTSFVGASAPFCEVLDSCGLTGSLTVSLAPRAETLRLGAERAIHRRVGRARAFSDLIARRLRLFANGPPPAGAVPLRVDETTERGGVPDCGDVVILGRRLFLGPALTFDERSPGKLTAGLVAPASFPEFGASDTLRTHCPGPASTDILGPSGGPGGDMAVGVIPLRQLLNRRLSLSLTNSGSFRSAGYSGSRRGSIMLSLSLLSARAGTRREHS